jgi:hypothetical protein
LTRDELIEKCAEGIYDKWMSVEEDPRPWAECSNIQKELGRDLARASLDIVLAECEVIARYEADRSFYDDCDGSHASACNNVADAITALMSPEPT